MKLFILGACKKIYLCLAILVIAMAILVTVARVATPIIAQHRSDVESVISKVMHVPVKVGHVSATWHLYRPMFRLDDVKIYSEKTHKVMAAVQKMYVSVDIIKSILNRQFEPGTLIVSGAHFSVKQLANGQFIIEGLSTEKLKSKQISFADMLDWLASQSTIAFHDISLRLTQQDGHVSKGFLNFSFEHHDNRSKIRGYLTLSEGQFSSKLHFVMNAHGDLSDTKKLKARFYLSGNTINLHRWLSGRSYHQIMVTRGILDFQMWGRWRHGKLESLDTQYGLTNLSIKNIKTKRNFYIRRSSGEIIWNFLKHNDWIITTNNLKVISDGPWLKETLTLKGQGTTLKQLYVKYLPLKDLQQFLRFSTVTNSSWLKTLSQLNPHGALTDLVVNTSRLNDKLQLDKFSVKVKQLGWKNWKNIPGTSRLTAYLSGNLSKGNIQLFGKKTSLVLAQDFEHPIQISSLAASLGWHKQNNQWELSIPSLTAITPYEQLNTQGRVLLVQGQSPLVELKGQFHTNKIRPSLVKTYLPEKKLDPKFVDWINHAIKKGGSGQAQFVIRGPITHFPFDDKSGTFITKGSFTGVNLKYDEDWPMVRNVEGAIEFSGRNLVITASKGTSLGSELNHITVSIPNINDDHPIILYAKGRVHGTLDKGLQFVLHSPLKKLAGKDISKIQPSGPATLDLALQIPIAHHSKNAPVKVNGTINLLNDKLTFPAWGNSISKINGQVHITENGLYAKDIKAMLLAHPASIDITTEHNQADPRVDITTHGVADVTQLNKIAKQPLSKDLAGQFAYVSLLTYARDGDVRLQVNTDLKGVAINVPAPFNKTQDKSLPSEFFVHNIRDKKYVFGFHYGHVVAGRMLFSNTNNNLKFEKGHIQFGVSTIQLPVSQKLIIDGNIKYASMADWKQYVSSHQSAKTQNLLPIILKNLHLVVAKVNIFDETFDNVSFSVDPQSEQVVVSMAANAIDGTMYFPMDTTKRIEARFTKLYLKPLPKKNNSSVQAVLGQFTPDSLPPLLVNCDDLRYGKKRFGHVGFETSKIPMGLSIDRIVGYSKHYTFTAKGQWTLQNNQSQTQLSGALTSNDTANAFKEWDVPANFHDQDAQINFNVTWPDAPYQLNSKHLNGVVTMRFGEGYIDGLSKSTDQKVGFGRLISLLSLQSLPRRLTLNFSDLVHKGFYFEKIRGDFQIKNGDAVTHNTYLDGSVAYIALNGSIDMNKQTYDLRMYIAPHLTSSLPVVAAIAGGPIIGGVTWVVNKMVTPEVQRLAHYVYLVQGPWDKPVMKRVK